MTGRISSVQGRDMKRRMLMRQANSGVSKPHLYGPDLAKPPVTLPRLKWMGDPASDMEYQPDEAHSH